MGFAKGWKHRHTHTHTHTPLHTYVRYAVSWKDIENAVVQKGSKFFSIQVVGLFSNSSSAVGGWVHAVRQVEPRDIRKLGRLTFMLGNNLRAQTVLTCAPLPPIAVPGTQ